MMGLSPGRSPVHLCGFMLFFLMLFAPATLQAIKAPFLLITLLGCLVFFLRTGGTSLHRTILALTALNVAGGLFFLIVGLVNDAPGVRSVWTVYLLWPLVFTLFVAALTPKHVPALFGVLLVATLAIELYSFTYLLASVGRLPGFLAVPLSPEQGFSFEDGSIEVSIPSIPTLIFTIPFFWACLLTWPRQQPGLLPRPLLWLAVVGGLAFILVSGRRAALLTVLLSPAITLFLWALQPPSEQALSAQTVRSVLGIACITGLILLLFLHFGLGVDLRRLVESVLEGFQFGATEDSAVRKEQFLALVREWWESPVVGQGHGAAARGSLRSFVQPWSYELSYAALLFHTGLAGMLIYGGSVFWVISTGLRVVIRGVAPTRWMLPALVGMACFLLANASNPYLEKYDFMWVLFLPIALVNRYLLQSSSLKAGGIPVQSAVVGVSDNE